MSSPSRSTSQTPSRSSAVLESARDSGSWSRQASYSACRARSSARAAAHRCGPRLRPGRPPLPDGDAGGAALARTRSEVPRHSPVFGGRPVPGRVVRHHPGSLPVSGEYHVGGRGAPARQLRRQPDAPRVGGHVLDAGDPGRRVDVDAPCGQRVVTLLRLETTGKGVNPGARRYRGVACCVRRLPDMATVRPSGFRRGW